jgi:hypothetical protein
MVEGQPVTTLEGYTGNDNPVSVTIIILNDEQISANQPQIGYLQFNNNNRITFENGSASRTWSEGNYVGETPSGGTGDTFTLSGIPSEHNGKYAFLNANTSAGDVLYGCQSGSAATGSFTLVSISNGSVSLPMWLYNTSNGNLGSYSGNNTCPSVTVALYNNGTVTLGGGSGSPVGIISFTNVASSRGGAARAWSAGTYTPSN